MAAPRPTIFHGEIIPPVARFSSAWETRLRPNFPPSKRVARLKNLHLDTALVAGGKPAAVLVVPAGRYRAEAEKIRAAVQAATGVALPIRELRDCPEPEKLVAETNLITFGNMADNPFLFHLYCRWLTLLDLKWPGKDGGSALLSLHNLFGSGHNAILAGGSDAAGVAAAADRLAARIHGATISGWLHDVTLGKGLTPPAPKPGATLRWWAAPPGITGAFGRWDRAPCFGWNSIATCACLYYMTGNEEFARAFKRLAMSRPGHVPEEIRKDYSYWNPANPLVETYHYYSYLIPMLWDLIEESPVFTNEERLYITNKFIEWQDHYDPHDNFGAPNGSRHASYQMLNIYTGSRYLAEYYPERRWFQRIANIRKAFDAWRGNPTWGELDYIEWLPTSEEFPYTFFILDDSWKPFAADGTAAELISPQLHCWSGKPREAINLRQAINLLHKAAWITRDPAWVWLARQADRDEDLETFRIGQSWWPTPDLAPKPPVRVVNRVGAVPLQRAYWERAGKTIPIELGSQYLAYRTTLDAAADYLRIDVSWFCDRTPYHLATPDLLRIRGRELINALGSVVNVFRQGLLETARTPQIAAVSGRVGGPAGAAIALEVPNLAFSRWRRLVLHRTGKCAVFVDAVTPKNTGGYEIKVSWRLAGALREPVRADGVTLVRTSAADLVAAGAERSEVRGGYVHLETAGRFSPAAPARLVSIFSPAAAQPPACRRLEDNAILWGRDLLVLAANADCLGLRFEGGAACLDPGALLAAGLRRLELDGFRLEADAPIALSWDLAAGRARIQAPGSWRLRLDGKEIAHGAAAAPVELALAAPAALESCLERLAALAPPPPPRRAEAAHAAPLLRLYGHARWENAGSIPALRFREPSDYARIDSLDLDAAAPFTIEAWVRPDRFLPPGKVVSQALVSKWDVAAGARSWMLALSRDRLALYVSPDGSWDRAKTHVGNRALRPGWNHVAVVFQPGTAALYVNGEPAGAFETGPRHACATPVVLGRYLPSGYPFTGRICGLRITRAALDSSLIGTHAKAGPGAAATPAPPPATDLLFALAAATPFLVPKGDLPPQWRLELPEPVRILEPSPPNSRSSLWAACDGGRLAQIDADGHIRRILTLPAEITALAAAPDPETAAALAAVVGLDNDELYGLDPDGKILCKEKAEIAPDFWLGGHWRAPWFTDPKNCHGVLALAFFRPNPKQPPEIALGRACTVEFRRLDGRLEARVPVRWGDRATLAAVPGPDGEPRLIAGNWRRSLGPNMQAIDNRRRVVGSVYTRLPGDYTRIHGHGQGFRFPVCQDLDGDGRPEFAIALCGSWNDLAVYDARTQVPKWVRVFGPALPGELPPGQSLVTAVRAGEIDPDGRRGLAVAARNGRLWLFGPGGEVRFTRRFPVPVTAALIAARRVIAGLADGTLRVFDAKGTEIHRAGLHGGLTALADSAGRVLAATDAGEIASFHLDPARSRP